MCIRDRFHTDRFETVIRIVRTLKRDYGISVMVSPGVVSPDIIDRLAEAGADFYALYQETHNRTLFQTLRVGQDYDERMQAKLYAKQKGMQIEEGILLGVGEAAEDIAESIEFIGEIGARQARAMSFVPQTGSPMEHRQTPDRMMELKTIALMRIRYPNALIPASLDVDGIAGMQSRIEAGANLVTSIIPPKSGLVGVAHGMSESDCGGRTVEETNRILNETGLRIASNEEYRSFLTQQSIVKVVNRDKNISKKLLRSKFLLKLGLAVLKGGECLGALRRVFHMCLQGCGRVPVDKRNEGQVLKQRLLYV
jgi:methylornithine synthase